MSVNNYFTTSLFLLFTLALSACSSTPSHLIIEPNILNTPSANYNNKTAQFEVTDMRTARHIVQISQENEAVILFSAEKRLENTIQNALTSQWKKQNLLINHTNTNDMKNTKKIHIIIEKALTRVSQYTLNYQIKTEIIIKVRITHGLQTQTTTFKNTGTSKGALQAGIADLEYDFNQRLTGLLTQVLTNHKIHSFLK